MTSRLLMGFLTETENTGGRSGQLLSLIWDILSLRYLWGIQGQRSSGKGPCESSFQAAGNGGHTQWI